ncbi:MAG: hypothetical protein ACQETH_05435 [Candidatus Rifleibacteriota bacterium]
MRLKKCFVLVLVMMFVVFMLSAATNEEANEIATKEGLAKAAAAQDELAAVRDNGLVQQKEFIASYLLDSFMFIHASFGHMQWTINAIHFTGEPVSMSYLPQMKHFNQKTSQMVKMFGHEVVTRAEKDYADRLLMNLKKIDQAIVLVEEDLKLKKRPKNKESKPMKAALKLYEETGKNIAALNELLGKIMAERAAEK